jgi:hypothetical protein
VIGTKDILPVSIELATDVDAVWKKAEDENELRPPAINDADEFERTGKSDGDHQQWKQEQENHAEYDQAIDCMDPSQKSHLIGKITRGRHFSRAGLHIKI